MRLSIFTLFLCTTATALCQSTAPAPTDPGNLGITWPASSQPAAISASFLQVEHHQRPAIERDYPAQTRNSCPPPWRRGDSHDVAELEAGANSYSVAAAQDTLGGRWQERDATGSPGLSKNAGPLKLAHHNERLRYWSTVVAPICPGTV